MRVTACATGTPRSGDRKTYHDRPPTGHDSLEVAELASEVTHDGGQGDAVLTKLPTDFWPVQFGLRADKNLQSGLWCKTSRSSLRLLLITYKPRTRRFSRETRRLETSMPKKPLPPFSSFALMEIPVATRSRCCSHILAWTCG